MKIVRTTDLELITRLNSAVLPLNPIDDDDLYKGVWWVAADHTAMAGVTMRTGKAFLSRACVLPEARGRGLQRRFVRVREAYARRHGALYTYTYVWVGNFASATSLCRCGYTPYSFERTNDFTYVWYRRYLRSGK